MLHPSKPKPMRPHKRRLQGASELTEVAQMRNDQRRHVAPQRAAVAGNVLSHLPAVLQVLQAGRGVRRRSAAGAGGRVSSSPGRRAPNAAAACAAHNAGRPRINALLHRCSPPRSTAHHPYAASPQCCTGQGKGRGKLSRQQAHRRPCLRAAAPPSPACRMPPVAVGRLPALLHRPPALLRAQPGLNLLG